MKNLQTTSARKNKLAAAMAAITATVALLSTGAFAPAAFAAGNESRPTPPLVTSSTIGLVQYKTLTWSDFRVDDSKGGMSAETGLNLNFSYRMQLERGAKNAQGEVVAPYAAHVSNIAFNGGFDPAHSWRKSGIENHPDATRLLAHEQGHLNIAEIGRRQLEATPLSALPEGRGETMQAAIQDLQAKLSVWYSAQSAQITARQLRYEADTDHSTQKGKQAEWSALLAREIDATNPAPNVALAHTARKSFVVASR